MKLFDNNAIIRSSSHSPVTESAEIPALEKDVLYPLLLEHAAIIVGKTIRTGKTFKFQTKLIKCSFNKDDIWAFVVRREKAIIICKVTCGPYKEFEILDEIAFEDMEDYVISQSKQLRLANKKREVNSITEILILIKSCIKRKKLESPETILLQNCVELTLNIRQLYDIAKRSGLSEKKIMDGMEVLYGELLTSPLPDGEPSILNRFKESMRGNILSEKIMLDLKDTILDAGPVWETVSAAMRESTNPTISKLTVHDLLKAIVTGRYNITPAE